MKKILIFLMMAGLLTACYDEFRLDYEYSSVAFSYVTGGSGEPGVLWRTVVKDEGLRLSYGIYLAGILDNTEERWADFEIDASLLDGTDYTLMPESWYSLSNGSRFVIPKGELIGRITITLDSASFISDPLSTEPNYAIPFRLTDTSEDTILATQNTQILVIKYINHYDGFYDQQGSFITLTPEGETLNEGSIDNVVECTTIQLDSVRTDGTMYLKGIDYRMKLLVKEDNSVFLEYIPNLNVVIEPANLGPESTASTSAVSSWEDLGAINDGDGAGIENSGPDKDPDGNAYGNWPNGETWNWVQYDFPSLFYVDKSQVYWWTDWDRDETTLPWPGIDIPYNTYVEVWDIVNEEWVVITNPNVNGVDIPAEDYAVVDTLVYHYPDPGRSPGCEIDQWNITTFDKVLTDKIRLNFVAVGSQGILEWEVWGIPGSAGYEMAKIESIIPNGTNVFDPASSTFTLNYRVDYTLEDYHTEVSSNMTWRNRIRDGVNEWRR